MNVIDFAAWKARRAPVRQSFADRMMGADWQPEDTKLDELIRRLKNFQAS